MSILSSASIGAEKEGPILRSSYKPNYGFNHDAARCSEGKIHTRYALLFKNLSGYHSLISEEQRY